VKLDSAKKQVTLANGWHLTAGWPFGCHWADLPLNLVVSPSKKSLAVTNQTALSVQTIQLIDVNNRTGTATGVVIPIKLVRIEIFIADVKNYLYASGGNDNQDLAVWLVTGSTSWY
jgi:hypothetical protein